MGFLWEEPPMKKYFVTLTTEERQSLHDLTAGGKASARKLAHARILLKADQADGGPAWPDERIAEALDVGLPTIARVRQQFVEQGLEAALGRKPPRGQAPLTAALPGGRRLVPPGPSGRGRELPLGFEPVVPVGADGLAPRQPEVVGAERDRLGGGTPALSPGAEGCRNATRLDRLRLGTARDLALQVGDRRLDLSPPRGRPELAESAPPDRLPYRLLIRPGNAWLL
jgi:Homeodomain-like domain